MEQELDFKKTKMSLRDSLNYKYVLDMLVDDLLAAKKAAKCLHILKYSDDNRDGNAWSARFSRLLAGGSLVFKSTIMRKRLYNLVLKLRSGAQIALLQPSGGTIEVKRGFTMFRSSWTTLICTTR